MLIVKINSITIAVVEYERILNLPNLLSQKSFFLFGPRSTGKTFLVNQQLKGEAMIINLLHSDTFLRLTSSPSELEGIIESGNKKIIVIDEVQRVPQLLAEVHRLLDKSTRRFLLTGSSARKLKKEGADMLAGRAWMAGLFPLCFTELPDFSLEKYLRYGGLPQVWQGADPDEELYSYVETYLKEEIRAEGIIRKLPPFARFLKAAALSNGELLNFTEIASDCAVPSSTVREYYAILEDTLIGFMLEPFIHSKKRKAIQTAKFYFFDTGVTHTIAGTRNIDRNSDLYGKSLEQFIGMELRAYLSYNRIREPLTFWRSTNGHEVDFLIGERTAIEVKATTKVSSGDLKGLKALSEEGIFENFFLISNDQISVKMDNITTFHWSDFLKRLWTGQIAF